MTVVVGDVVRIDDFRARRRMRGAFSRGGITTHPRSDDFGARWVSRVAPALTLPVARESQTFAVREAVTRHRVWANPPLDARELPVMLIGGLAGTAEQLQLLEE